MTNNISDNINNKRRKLIMKARELNFIKEMATDRIQQKIYRLNTYKDVYKHGLWTKDLGLTKEELEHKIKELEEYINIATH